MVEIDADTVLFEVCLELRWRDLDAYAHVNNSVFLTLLEEARIQWFESLPEPWRSAAGEPVLARTEVNYRVPIHHPARVRVQLLGQRLGRSSATIGHRISAVDGSVLHSDGASVLVWVTPADGRPVALPEQIRNAFARASQRRDASQTDVAYLKSDSRRDR